MSSFAVDGRLTRQKWQVNGMFTKKSASKHGRKGLKNNKKPSAKTLKVYEFAAAAAERKAVAAEVVAAEAKEGALGADAIDAASQEAFWARKRAAEASANRIVYSWR